MSSILTSAIAGINAIKVMIDSTIKKIDQPDYVNPEKRIFIENTVEESNLSAGVKIKEIYDNYNNFIIDETRKTSVEVTGQETKIEQLLKLENLLCEKSNIFSVLAKELYGQIKNNFLFNKKNVIGKDIEEKLNQIIDSLQDFDNKLIFLEKEIKQEIGNKIKKVNSLINKIHETNLDICCFPIYQLPGRVEDFIKKREHFINELNKLIGITVIKENSNYKVYLNNGICIIDNEKKQNLIELTSNSDSKYISVGYFDDNAGKVKKAEFMIPNGSLGALLRFRREELEHVRNKIGQLTVNFTDSINLYHQIGFDSYGNVGEPMIRISEPQIISHSKHTSSSVVSAKWVSFKFAKDSNYAVFFHNNNWTVTRLLDHEAIPANIKQENNNIFITFDGIELKIQGKPNEKDFYEVKPYLNTLEKLDLLIDKDTPFSFNDDTVKSNMNIVITHNFNEDHIVDQKETIQESYQNFSKSIAYQCNFLEENLPFKEKMIDILNDKKLSMSRNLEQDCKNLNYQQQCYLANSRVLKVAEDIFNEIVECYS
ncbi:flagellar hook protein [Buchnera aphidicola (Muscaphis stroyani)]|uniref:Flagellar hook-associated protein 1 n=1 Tax=Buchnera aphidicola (Muscaphis stroyani) TaxID=1241869 RepID=A0A4D6Y4R2_9GAMM|nr:flagellar hook protein [Buchnera aphidicola]QCI24412.1 flagellar hook protein [Buchnera aphidicola (Muscaphis stroyani)]